jgi:hypothetical protein
MLGKRNGQTEFLNNGSSACLSWLKIFLNIRRLTNRPTFAQVKEARENNSLVPSFQTTSKRPLNDWHCGTVSAKRAMSGASLLSGLVGIRS